jgi:hypothetical protein
VSSTFARTLRRRSIRPAALLALLGALAAPLAACGPGAGKKPSGARLTVTRDFGSRAQRELTAPKVSGQETVMRLLQRNAKVTTRFGGGFVQSIDGVAGGRRGGRPVDWFFYVNGIEASAGAAAIRLHPGDRVWWDRHDWGAAMRVPAVVGSYPEPFVHGTGGKRLPVRLECADPEAPACNEVFEALSAEGVPAAKGGLRTNVAPETLRVIVGPWSAARDETGLRQLEAGPATSGVYARPSADGRRLALLDATGRAIRTVGSGSGLIAAARQGDQPPIWAVTGTDAAGVDAAARAFGERTLERRFAVAVVGGRAVGLPEAPAR